MFEKLHEKITLIEVMKDVVSKLESLHNEYVSYKTSAQENLDKAEPDSWWIENYKQDIVNYDRKLAALEKISNTLEKLI